MFDPIRNEYSLRCPTLERAVSVPVSSFRTVRRLRGAQRPAIFRVEHDCPCGDRHVALVPHDELDWAPLGTGSSETYTDLASGSRDLVGNHLGELATSMLSRGRWPWAFWCRPESALRPGFPSSLRFVTPEHGHGPQRLGVLVRCWTCARHTVNIVSREHLDVPWHVDRMIGVVDQPFAGEQQSDEERFRHQLELGPTHLRPAS